MEINHNDKAMLDETTTLLWKCLPAIWQKGYHVTFKYFQEML
jgi:hypothetical protein